jgi:predicted metal-binding protein
MVQKTIYICNGCCCGHPEKGNPPVQNALFDALVKDDPTICIERPYCLGPCHMANVVKVERGKKEYWFQHVNTEENVKNVVAFVKKGSLPLPLQKKVRI